MPKTFELRITDFWKNTTQGLSDKMKRIVNDKVENHIKNKPYTSESLHGPLEGLWSYNRLSTDNRIIFAVCEDCRKRGLTPINNCKGCQEISNDTIMLWAFGGHDIYKELGRQRKKTWQKEKRRMKKKLRRP